MCINLTLVPRSLEWIVVRVGQRMSFVADFFDKYEYKNGSLIDKVSSKWLDVIKSERRFE